MSDDIVARLRGAPPTNSTLDRYEAADEITRLTAERDAAVARAEANGRAAKVRQSHIDDLQKMLDAAEAERDAAHGNADDNYRKLMEARALLREARPFIEWPLSLSSTELLKCKTQGLLARIDAALKGDGE